MCAISNKNPNIRCVVRFACNKKAINFSKSTHLYILLISQEQGQPNSVYGGIE
jgi:hypothetical protein